MTLRQFVCVLPHARQTAFSKLARSITRQVVVMVIVISASCMAYRCSAQAVGALTLPDVVATKQAGEKDVSESNSVVTVEQLKQRQEELADRRHHVQQALKAAQTNAVPSGKIEDLRMELELLKYFELICAQHVDELKRRSELEEDLRNSRERLHELRAAGPEEPKPYSILLLDDVSDQLEGEQTRLETIKSELAAAKEMQETTRRMREESEAKRRQMKEALEAADDDVARQTYAKRLALAKLESQLHSAIAQLRRTELANGDLERQACELGVIYLQEKHEIIRADVVFTKDHLKTVLSELDKFDADLRSELSRVQLRLQELETQAYDSQQQQDQQISGKLQQVMTEGWKVARQSYRRQVAMIQQRLREFVIARLAWDIRFRIFNQQATREELDGWEEDAKIYYERISANRHSLEDESRALMVELGRKEKQVRIARRTNPEVARWIEFQIASMHELSQAYASNLVQVETVERMLGKLNSMLRDDLQPQTARDLLSELGVNLKAAWNYEITSVDDRPITVRKVVAGILLMLLGFYTSRHLSRVVGRRMLPRIGLDNGAATAIQSISFYVLLTCFGFVSLELVNVPITIFTFLGGAVAIGVGFGSQNILNNFISGLILLTEQPIRVGDLVDIGGLCGNVEKIGARSTRVKTGANLEIIVPNSKFLEDNVTNWTLSDTRMRTCVQVGVAYGAPTDEVARLLKVAVDQCPHAMNEPEPIVLFNEFGDNALNFEVHFWIHVRTMMQARKIESDLRHAIDRLLREADITIAFPQRDVHLDAVKPIEVNIRQIAQEQGFAVRRREAA